jgi:2-keto-4-pentenoate hydratase
MSNGDTHSGIGANALGDPVEALAWLVNELTRQGRAVEAGQFVTTGTCVTPIPVSPGDTIAADYGWLGRLHVRFG